jgi:lactoylglutathione lyase
VYGPEANERSGGANLSGDLRLELFYDDVDRALAFYTDVLGFVALPTEYDTYRPIERDGIRLALQSVDFLGDDHPLLRGGRDAPRGQCVELVLEVEDLDALHDRVRAAGVDATPIEHQPWGLRDFRVVDPEGYYLRFTIPTIG